MPPLHPALVHFPIALVSFSFITDLLGRLFNRSSLRAAAFWTLIGALIGGACAAAAGYYDMTRDTLGETYKYVDFHQDMGWILVGAVAVLNIRPQKSAFSPFPLASRVGVYSSKRSFSEPPIEIITMIRGSICSDAISGFAISSIRKLTNTSPPSCM